MQNSLFHDDLNTGMPHHSIQAISKRLEDLMQVADNGAEYWEGQDLMDLLEYRDWRSFLNVIKKASEACKRSGHDVKDHFRPVYDGNPNKPVNYWLTRYACYLVAQNGDSRKGAIASAQTYFALQARKQEMFDQMDEEDKRVYVRQEIKKENKELISSARRAGVRNFGKFFDAGYKGLYGMSLDTLRRKKGIGKDSVLDRAGSTELAANLFRITQADAKLKTDKITNEGRATIAHYVIGSKVRSSIKDIGGTMPEELPVERHIEEIETKQEQELAEESESLKGVRE